MRHCVGAAQLPTADAVAESAECGMSNLENAAGKALLDYASRRGARMARAGSMVRRYTPAVRRKQS